MPNRIIRDWTDSESIEKLSPLGEVFFTRLIMKADDYGNYIANPKLILSNLFPLKEHYRKSNVVKWINECLTLGLIIEFTNDGKQYLNIPNFRQKLRRMKHKYPTPNDEGSMVYGTSDGQVTDNSRTSADNVRPESESESEEESESETKPNCADASARVWPTFYNFWEKYDKNVGKMKCMKLWNNIPQGGREKIMEHLEQYTLTEKRYRKDPERYLKNKAWEDEIIIKQNQNGVTDRRKQNIANLIENFGKRVIKGNSGK